MNQQDITCQQILNDSDKWINVASKIREDWKRCFEELLNLERLLEEDRHTRIVWSKRLKIFGFALSIIQNIVAGIAALIPLFRYQSPNYVGYTLSGITFILSLSLWSRLNERAYEYLILAKDSQRLAVMCKNIRQMLHDVISDGRITERERSLIRDMMGEMHKRSEEIGSLDLMMKILGTDVNNSSFKFFGPSNANYKNSCQGVDDILNEIKSSQKEINAKVPHVIREYRDVQLESQIHSRGDPRVVQRFPPIVIQN